MGKFSDDAARLLELVGGKENISAVTHCITRMRFVLANDPNCDTNEPPLASGGSLGVKGVHSTRFSLAWRLESRKPLCYNTVKNLTVNKQTEGGGL